MPQLWLMAAHQQPGMVVYACIPCYSGSWGRTIIWAQEFGASLGNIANSHFKKVCPFLEWTYKIFSICAVGYYPTIKRNEVLTFHNMDETWKHCVN
jgi:hypothetical protein